MSATFTTRPAVSDDYEFLFDLKKVAELGPITAIFGWDEELQKEMHQQEWLEAKPTIIEVDGERVGSYLVEEQDDQFYFGRFFLLPRCQGQGIGSAILDRICTHAGQQDRPIGLCYLQGNRVGELYARFGFQITTQDHQFVHMIKMP